MTPSSRVSLRLALLSCATAFASASAGQFVVEKANLRVVEPATLAGSHDTALANFGVPRYGATLVGQVVYDASNALGCELFRDLPRPGARSGHATFALVDRGDCYFVEKAWHAQLAGADAVLVADDVDEPLLTMANVGAESDARASELAERITVPSALVSKSLGDALRNAASSGGNASFPIVALDWSDAIAHPDDTVEWELWTTSNQMCGRACDATARLINEMRDAATSLAKSGRASFAAHFVTWSCGERDANSRSKDDEPCPNLCVRRGRYCAPDPAEGFGVDAASADLVRRHGYNGSDVVSENARQLCLRRELDAPRHGNATWLWWDYAVAHAAECVMTEGTFDADCSRRVMRDTLRMDDDAIRRVDDCVGDDEADEPNDALESEMRLQADADDSGRGAIVLLPTVVINLDQYRGKLDGADVLRAVCAGFAPNTEPDACLSAATETNECEQSGNAGCWFFSAPAAAGRPAENFTACVDTFRGYRCACPPGFEGDGVRCVDVDECADDATNDCQQRCVNFPGGHECACDPGYALVGKVSCVRADVIEGRASRGPGPGSAFAVVVIVLAVVGAGGYAAYRLALRRRIDREVRAIMADYMPLEDDRERGVAIERGVIAGGGGMRRETEMREK